MVAATVLALGSALLHTTWNLILKRAPHHERDLTSWGLFAFGGLLALPVLAVVGSPGVDALPWLALSACIHAAYVQGLVRAYGHGDFSLAYPLARGGGALVAALGGAALLGDELSPPAWVAIGVVALGLVSLMGRGVSGQAVEAAGFTALAIGSYTLADAQGARTATTGLSYGLAIMVATALAVSVVFGAQGRGAALLAAAPDAWRSWALAGACTAAAYAMVLVAMRRAPVGYVAVLREPRAAPRVVAGDPHGAGRSGRRHPLTLLPTGSEVAGFGAWGDRPVACPAMERFGFVGLPNSGKSSLYNALAGGGALAAPDAFATTDPNVGVAKVPDRRLDLLSVMSNTKKTVPASVQFVDIGGLVEGASTGEGLGNQFLAHIREVDTVVYLLRAFEDSDVPGPSDPLECLRVLEIELALADLETVESRIDKRRKAAKQDKSLAEVVDALGAAQELLAEGVPIYRGTLTEAQREALKPEFLLTNKPVLALVNVGEDDLDRIDEIIAPVEAELSGRAEVIGMCVQLEAEAAQFTGAERLEMLEALGLGEGGLERFIHAAYQLMGLRTYFTTGEKETRAWTFRAGSKAPQCAGRIHTDFERGFIRAEVIHWDELLEIGSWSKAREVGKLRVEGKDYEVIDGDVLEFRFNV